MRKTIISGSLAIALLMSNCATIFTGSQQTIKFDSNPGDATILVDGIEIGKTPFETKLERTEHTVQIKLEGYQTYSTKLTKKINGWFWGNIFIGGILGIIVDASTGAIYKLSPDDITAAMVKNVASTNKNDIYIAVDLNVDPTWKKIGQLAKTN
jgi:hypothetical protein